MKFDDLINGAIAILLGGAIILNSRGMTGVAHIEYGPGFFPAIAGGGLVVAGLVLIARRVLTSQGVVVGFVASRASGRSGVFGFFLILALVAGYILLADTLGFLIVAPVFVFALVYWFERRLGMSLAAAALGAIAFHTFFYQFMSAPLPWGLLEPWAGRLTW